MQKLQYTVLLSSHSYLIIFIWTMEFVYRAIRHINIYVNALGQINKL